MPPEKKPTYMDTVAAMRRFEALRPDAEKRKREDTAKENLPQGHLSGLNADMLDGLHAEDILSEIRNASHPKMVGGGGGTAWYDGVVAPAAGLGADGDYYLNTVAGDVYHNEMGVWMIIGNLMGGVGVGSVWYSGAGVPN